MSCKLSNVVMTSTKLPIVSSKVVMVVVVCVMCYVYRIAASTIQQMQ